MAITSADQLATGFRQTLSINKIVPPGPGAGNWSAYWLGGPAPQGSNPTPGVAGVALSDADVGTYPFTNPGSGLTYLAGVTVYSTQTGTLLIYDRLWHNSGLSPTTTTAQTVNSVTLPSRCPVKSDPTGRTVDALGNQVEAWFETYGTAMGASTTIPTISYTDEAGNSGNTGTAIAYASAAVAQQCFPFDLAAGDRGVRSIQSYTQSATNTSGVFGLVLRCRIASIKVLGGNEPTVVTWSGAGMPAIPDDAHLEFVGLMSSVNPMSIFGTITLVSG